MSDALRLHGLLGDKKPTGNAVAGDVRAGKTFSNANGTDVTGTLAVRTGDNVALAISTLGNTFKLRPPAGIYDGVTDMVTHTDANRIASNIRQGVVLDGITGTLAPATMIQGNVTSVAGPGGSGQCTVNVGARAKMLIWWYDTPTGSGENEGGFGFDRVGNGGFNAPTYWDSNFSTTYETTGFRGQSTTFRVRTEEYAQMGFDETTVTFFTAFTGKTYRYIAIY